MQEKNIYVLVEGYEDVCQQGLAEALTSSSLHLTQENSYIGLSRDVHNELEDIDLIIASLQA